MREDIRRRCPLYLSFGERYLMDNPYRVSRFRKAPSLLFLGTLWSCAQMALVAKAWVREKRHTNQGQRLVPSRQLTESVVSKPPNVRSTKETEGVLSHVIEGRSSQGDVSSWQIDKSSSTTSLSRLSLAARRFPRQNI